MGRHCSSFECQTNVLDCASTQLIARSLKLYKCYLPTDKEIGLRRSLPYLLLFAVIKFNSLIPAIVQEQSFLPVSALDSHDFATRDSERLDLELQLRDYPRRVQFLREIGPLDRGGRGPPPIYPAVVRPGNVNISVVQSCHLSTEMPLFYPDKELL